MHDGHLGKPGYFPSNSVVLVDKKSKLKKTIYYYYYIFSIRALFSYYFPRTYHLPTLFMQI